MCLKYFYENVKYANLRLLKKALTAEVSDTTGADNII